MPKLSWPKKNVGQTSIFWPKRFLPRPVLQKPTLQAITPVVFLRQFPNDLLLNESDSSRLTDIVDVKLYNPVTKRLINAGTLGSPVNFLIPLKSGKTFPNGSYVEVGFEPTTCFTNFSSNGICKLRERLLINCFYCFGSTFSQLFTPVACGLIKQSELENPGGNQIPYRTQRFTLLHK